MRPTHRVFGATLCWAPRVTKSTTFITKSLISIHSGCPINNFALWLSLNVFNKKTLLNYRYVVLKIYYFFINLAFYKKKFLIRGRFVCHFTLDMDTRSEWFLINHEINAIMYATGILLLIKWNIWNISMNYAQVKFAILSSN